MVTSTVLIAVLALNGQCRVVWQGVGGIKGGGHYGDCRTAEAWSEFGNRQHPDVQHQIQRAPVVHLKQKTKK